MLSLFFISSPFPLFPFRFLFLVITGLLFIACIKTVFVGSFFSNLLVSFSYFRRVYPTLWSYLLNLPPLPEATLAADGTFGWETSQWGNVFMTSSYWSQQNFRFGSWRKDRKTTISMDGTGVFFRVGARHRLWLKPDRYGANQRISRG